jgi:ABC-2 type transport system ATP-binding protein
MLQIEALTKVFPGGVVALQDVSLELATGMFGLLGPNGAGKSTLMKVVSGLLAPSSGQVRLDGQDIVANPAYVRDRLGYLPQDFGFYPHLSGRQMLEFLLRIKGVSGAGGLRQTVDRLLGEVNLADVADRKVGTYSGGMRQRLGIAQAIAGDPRLVIVDEPTAGLDPQERQRTYRLLSELARDRIVILSTHIVEDVAVLCPRFAVLRAGRLVDITTPSRARHALNGNIFEATVSEQELPGIHERFRVTQAFLVEGEMRVRVHARDAQVPGGFQPVPATLEDAFVLMMAPAPQAAIGRRGP